MSEEKKPRELFEWKDFCLMVDTELQAKGCARVANKIAAPVLAEIAEFNREAKELRSDLQIAVEALEKIKNGWECSACSCECHDSASKILKKIKEGK
jgi:hypothetical protein